jgi:hypothetical protein
MATPSDEDLERALTLRSPTRATPTFGAHALGPGFPVTEAALNEIAKDTSSGAEIRAICPFAYWQTHGDTDFESTDNHCAHFVSHVLGIAGDTKQCAERSAEKAWGTYLKRRAAANATPGAPKPKYRKLIASEGRIGRPTGVCIEVLTLFRRCEARGVIKEWPPERPPEGEPPAQPPTEASGLMFIGAGGKRATLRRAGDRWSMTDGPLKHVGIFVGDLVWHFSNGKFRRAVRQTSAEMRGHYGGDTILVYATALPERSWSPPPPP